MKFKVIAFIVLCFLIDGLGIYFAQTVDANTKSDLALAAVNGGVAEHSALRTYGIAANQLYLALGLSNLVIGLILFWSNIKSLLTKLSEENQ